MTDPAQYISGRTVEEQMNSLISYVDTRAADVANAAVADEESACQQAVTDAQAARDAAVAAKDTAVAAATDTVRKTPSAAQTITGGYDLTLNGNFTVSGDANITGTDGKLTAKSAVITNTLSADNVTISNDLTVGAASTFSGTEVHGGTETHNGTVTLVGDTTAGKLVVGTNLNVSGSLTASGTENHAGAETHSGAVAFTGSATVPTADANSSSDTAVNIAFTALTDGTNNLVHTNSNETINGTKTMPSLCAINNGYLIGNFTYTTGTWVKLLTWTTYSDTELRIYGTTAANGLGSCKVYFGGSNIYTRWAGLSRYARFEGVQVKICYNASAGVNELWMYDTISYLGNQKVYLSIMQGSIPTGLTVTLTAGTEPTEDGTTYTYVRTLFS